MNSHATWDHTVSDSVTCHPAEVTFPPLPQPKLVLDLVDLATPDGCKAELAVITCGWEGYHRSGVALAMRHRLQWFIHLRARGPRKGDAHPAYTPGGVWHSSPYAIIVGGDAALAT